MRSSRRSAHAQFAPDSGLRECAQRGFTLYCSVSKLNIAILFGIAAALTVRSSIAFEPYLCLLWALRPGAGLTDRTKPTHELKA